MSSPEELQAEIDKLRAENQALKKPVRGQMFMKVSEKGGLSVYGLGRFPVTLYREQWEKLLGMADEIRQFIQENDGALKKRNSGGTMEERFETGGPDGIEGILHRPDRPNGDAFALTHGAGSNMNAPLLARISGELAAAGYVVLRYNLPFRRQRPKGPPFPAQASRDREGVVRAAEALRGLDPSAPLRVFVGGHSYGGRQSAMAAAEHAGVADGLLLFSYPLHPPGKPAQKRTSFFGDLRVPALFVHGAQDPFGTLEELRQAMALIPARTDLLAVEGAGHDLKRAADLASELLTRFHALVG